MKLLLRLVATILILNASFARSDEIVAAFQDDVQPGWPKPGWLYLYNISPIDDFPDFLPLLPTPDPVYLYSRDGTWPRVEDYMNINASGGHPGSGLANGPVMEFVAPFFTVSEDGYYEIQNSQIQLVDPAGTTVNSDGVVWFAAFPNPDLTQVGTIPGGVSELCDI